MPIADSSHRHESPIFRDGRSGWGASWSLGGYRRHVFQQQTILRQSFSLLLDISRTFHTMKAQARSLLAIKPRFHREVANQRCFAGSDKGIVFHVDAWQGLAPGLYRLQISAPSFAHRSASICSLYWSTSRSAIFICRLCISSLDLVGMILSMAHPHLNDEQIGSRPDRVCGL